MHRAPRHCRQSGVSQTLRLTCMHVALKKNARYTTVDVFAEENGVSPLERPTLHLPGWQLLAMGKRLTSHSSATRESRIISNGLRISFTQVIIIDFPVRVRPTALLYSRYSQRTKPIIFTPITAPLKSRKRSSRHHNPQPFRRLAYLSHRQRSTGPTQRTRRSITTSHSSLNSCSSPYS
jgi:hypothetical protein